MNAYIPKLSSLSPADASEIRLLFQRFYDLHARVQTLPKPFTAAQIKALTAVSNQVRLPAQADPQLNIGSALVDAGASISFESVLGSGVVLEDTHANRLTNYPPANYPVGAVFFETDRTVIYVVKLSAGANVWTYASGIMVSTFANRPTDLGTNDTNFLLYITTGTSAIIYDHGFIWSGTAWLWNGDRAGIFCDCAINPGDGFQLCDGTVTKYLSVGADLTENSFTTPDETTANPGTYHKSIAAYTGTINAAVAPVFTGTQATLTGSVSAPTFTGNAATLTGSISTPTFTGSAMGTHQHELPIQIPDATITRTIDPTTFGTGTSRAAIANTSMLADTTSAPVAKDQPISAGTPSGTISTPTLTMNSYTPTGTNSAPTLTMNAYTPAGTIDTSGQPKNMGVLRYFRR